MVAATGLLDRFKGAMLGHALGDALGVPFEGVPADVIARDLGTARRLLARVPDAEIVYSDDTQMMIGTAESLIAYGGIDTDDLAARFAANYDAWRGYGQGARKLIEGVAAGHDWRTLVRSVFADGSYGNGAAMRATPVGLFCCGRPDALEEAATLSATVTHQHPLGVEGAVLFSAAVAEALRYETPFRPAAFFEALRPHATTEEFQWQLRTAARLTPDDAIPFGSSLPAHRSVVSALCCFVRTPDSFLDAVGTAVSLGDDTDTLAGMAAALVGARGGTAVLPAAYLQRLENGAKGRSYIDSLAERLFDRWQRLPDTPSLR